MHVWSVRVGGRKFFAVGVVFDMQVFAAFQEWKYAHMRANPVFRVPSSHCNFKTRGSSRG